MPSTDTESQVLDTYAADAAYVAEQEPATGLATFAQHLTVAAARVTDVDLLGAAELTRAASLLVEAVESTTYERPAILARAEKLLRAHGEALEEYREMCGG